MRPKNFKPQYIQNKDSGEINIKSLINENNIHQNKVRQKYLLLNFSKNSALFRFILENPIITDKKIIDVSSNWYWAMKQICAKELDSKFCKSIGIPTENVVIESKGRKETGSNNCSI